MSVEWGKIVKSINWTLLMAGVINFGLLLYILKRLLFKPAMEFLDRRREQIAARIEAARQSESQALALVSEKESEMRQARVRADEILAQARREAEAVIAQARAAAKNEASKILSDSKERLEQERDHMIHDLREAYAEIAVLGAERVLDREIRSEDHRRLLDQLLEEIDEETLRIPS
ncbi:F0F1 ATP synthase subunit B [Candidatus Bipolaricaulota bacterium]|nr:F0F1 ATP synthase subunit B [Candidatus Bipolaricaulota bacterium]TFH11225.1 MAG: F0F1 ATP synthase subunit B [Candidatus Atribacteria bacterium]